MICRFYVLVILLSLFCLHAFAGHEGGGKLGPISAPVGACDPDSQSICLIGGQDGQDGDDSEVGADIEPYGHEGGGSQVAYKSASDTLTQLSKLDPERSQRYRQELQDLFMNKLRASWDDSLFSDNSGRLYTFAPAQSQKNAVQSYFINMNAWMKMSSGTKAAALVYLLVQREEWSIHNRYSPNEIYSFIRFVTSKQLSSMSLSQYGWQLAILGLPYTIKVKDRGYLNSREMTVNLRLVSSDSDGTITGYLAGAQWIPVGYSYQYFSPKWTVQFDEVTMQLLRGRLDLSNKTISDFVAPNEGCKDFVFINAKPKCLVPGSQLEFYSTGKIKKIHAAPGFLTFDVNGEAIAISPGAPEPLTAIPESLR